MDQEVRYLPFSGRRYLVSREGAIFDNEENVLNTFLQDGSLKVELSWIFGNQLYDVGLLVLVAYGRTDLDEHLLLECEPLYIDDNPLNVRLDNLTYRFRNGPIEDEVHKGYYIVPFFEKYAISHDGQLLNRKKGTHLSWAISLPNLQKNSQGGYRYLRAVAPSGFSLVLFRHRAIGYVFVPYDSSVHQRAINHKNGIPGDDAAGNLEWVTYGENARHAAETGLRSAGLRRVVCKDYGSGEVRIFNGVSLAAKAFQHLTRYHILYRLEDGANRLFPDKLLFRDYAETIEWPSESDLLAVKEMPKIQYLVRNVLNDETQVASGLDECARITGVAISQISTHVTNQHEIPIHGYLVRRLDGSPTWPSYSDKHLQIFRNHSKQPCNGVDVVDTETNETQFFCCREAAGKHFGISPQYVGDLCTKKLGHSGTPLYKKRYKFSNFLIRCKGPSPRLG